MHEALPKFSEKKQETMHRFITDKTCQWWEETKSEEAKEELTETNNLIGTGSKLEPHHLSLAFKQQTLLAEGGRG